VFVGVCVGGGGGVDYHWMHSCGTICMPASWHVTGDDLLYAVCGGVLDRLVVIEWEGQGGGG
jgi:hypothetical protein